MPLTNRIYSKHIFCHTAHHYSHGRPRINCMSDNVVVYGNKVRVVCHRRLRELLLLSLQIDRPLCPYLPSNISFPLSEDNSSSDFASTLFVRYRSIVVRSISNLRSITNSVGINGWLWLAGVNVSVRN